MDKKAGKLHEAFFKGNLFQEKPLSMQQNNLLL
jgi:hypothetical protein